jgi:hypothetical protein
MDTAPPSPFRIQHPLPGVWHLVFPERPGSMGLVDMAFHFLRFQEHYESPGFKGTVFGWAAYVRWYRLQRGSFSYPSDWNGFNIPGSMLRPFREGSFDPLTRREKVLLQALSEVRDDDYVIGTQEGDAGSLDHELAHALWHMDPRYRREVEAILEGGDYSRQEAALGEGSGYDPLVFRDEIQACAVDGHEDYAPDQGRSAAVRRLFMDRLRSAQGPVKTD